MKIENDEIIYMRANDGMVLAALVNVKEDVFPKNTFVTVLEGHLAEMLRWRTYADEPLEYSQDKESQDYMVQLPGNSMPIRCFPSFECEEGPALDWTHHECRGQRSHKCFSLQGSSYRIFIPGIDTDGGGA